MGAVIYKKISLDSEINGTTKEKVESVGVKKIDVNQAPYSYRKSETISVENQKDKEAVSTLTNFEGKSKNTTAKTSEPKDNVYGILISNISQKVNSNTVLYPDFKLCVA